MFKLSDKGGTQVAVKSPDEQFYRDFNKMVKERAGRVGPIDIYRLSIPSIGLVAKNKRVYIKGITEKYYERLNHNYVVLWTKPKCKRRLYDSKGQFLKENGVYKTESVSVPRNSLVVVSQIKLGVPHKFKSEDYIYVDYVETNSVKQYIYIVPKSVCYEVNQTALVLAVNPLRAHYGGVSFHLQTGHKLYLYTVPYSPTKRKEKTPYRYLVSKIGLDFSKEVKAVFTYWEQLEVVFRIEDTALLEAFKGVLNASYTTISPTLGMYKPHDIEKSLEDSVESIYGGWE